MGCVAPKQGSVGQPFVSPQKYSRFACEDEPINNMKLDPAAWPRQSSRPSTASTATGREDSPLQPYGLTTRRSAGFFAGVAGATAKVWSESLQRKREEAR
mmetsp:Transcript_54351/g.75303  ORF Transcript_54351/g.75303 Transcript_54351/m.75303 type:complete len:100 (+) Transcript_54351:52-351(+)|eukprot:s58_g13.t1